MNLRVLWFAVLLVSAVSFARAAQDEFVLKNRVLSRTISYGAGLLKTTKFEVTGEKLLAQPTVEFLLEFDVDGGMVMLSPGDFDIKNISSRESNRRVQTEIELACKRSDFPISVFVRYHTSPDWTYMQKSIYIKPVSKVNKATLRRVVVEDLVLNPQLKMTEGGFAFVNPASGKGFYAFVSSLYGSQSLAGFGGLLLAEEANHRLESAYETGRVTVGVGMGGAEAIDTAYRDFVWQNYCIGRSRKQPTEEFAEVSLDLSDPRQRVQVLGEFAEKCREMRKSDSTRPLCSVLRRIPLPSDVFLLSVVDAISVDLSGLGEEDSTVAKEKLLRTFPVETLRFVLAGAPSESPE